MKKIISLALCICMALTTVPAAFAAQVESASKSWLQTFTGYEDGVPDEMELGNINEGITDVYGANGLFGKSADDTAFALKVDVSEGTTVGNEATYPYIQWTRGRTNAGIENFESGDIFCWGYEFALDSYYGTKDIRLDVQNQDNLRKSFALLAMPNNAGGKTTCNGQVVTSFIPLNTWVNFDFVLYTDSNLIDVYYNGTKVISAMDLSSVLGTSTSRINFYRMFMRPQLVDGAYAVTNNYVDNFYAKVVKQSPVIEPVSISSLNSKVTVSEALKTISADDSLTVEQFLSVLDADESYTMAVVDKNGINQTGNIKEGYLRIETAEGRNGYYLITTFSPSKLKYNTMDSFMGVTLTNNQTNDGMIFYGAANDFAQGVEEDKENAVKIHTEAGGKASIRKLNMTAADTGDTFAVAFDIKNDSYGASSGLTVRYENASGSTSNYNDIINFKEDGSITFSYNNAGSYELNKWYHITIFASKETKQARLYIDGEFKTEITWSILSSFNRFIDAIWYNNGVVDSEKNTYFDNLCIMPINSVSSVDTSVMDIKTEIANKNIVSVNNVSGYGEMTVGEFKSGLTYPEKASVTVYNGSSVCEDSEKLCDGMLVKIIAEDGRHKAVYYIKESIRSSSEIKINDKTASQVYEGIAKGEFSGYVQTPTEIELVIEEYKNDTLIQKKSSAETVSNDFTVSVSLDNTVSEEPGSKIKFGVYDKDKNLIVPIKVIEYSDLLDFSTEITGAYGGKDAIYSITMDDGYTKSLENYYKPWFEKYGLTGSTLAICNWMTPEFLAVSQPMVAEGKMGIMSHSYTHPGTEAALEANANQEVYGSQEYLRELFPGQDVLSYGPGGGIMTSSVFTKVKDAYYANRAGTRGYNNLDMSDSEWYDIKVQGVLGGSGTTWQSSANNYDGETVESMNKWLDYAVENNKWLVEMWHSVCWTESEGSTSYVSDGGYRPIPDDIGEQHMAYASKLQSEGKIWVAQFDDAVKYLRERQNTKVTDNATRTSRTIDLECSLDAAVFNHPLTMKSQVPASWEFVKITQGDIVTYKQSKADESGSYIVYDAILGCGQIVLEKADSLGEDTYIEKLGINTPANLKQEIIEGEKFESVSFGVSGDFSLIDTNDIVWYVNGSESGRGTEFKYTPTEGGEAIIYARYARTCSQNRRVKTKVNVPSRGVQITNLKYRGNAVTLEENTQEFDSNNALKFMWGDMSNEKMSFQHGWYCNIKNIPEALKDAKFMTTGADFATVSDDNYLEFNVDRDVIVVGMYEGPAAKTNLASDGWTICSVDDNKDKLDTYKYMRGDKTSYFTYMFYKEFSKDEKVTIPYAGVSAWASGGGFAVVENVKEPEIKEYTLNVSSMGGEISASLNDAASENWGVSKTDVFAMGTKITLSAAADESGKQFLYWKNDLGVILSENAEYSFIMGSGTNLIAVYSDTSDYYITFKNANGRVIAAGHMSSAITVPEDPYIMGYVFSGWYIDGVKQNLSKGDIVSGLKKDTVIKAGYKLEETMYTVTLINADREGGEYKYNAYVSVKPVVKEGEEFSYWTKDGRIVSYDKNYSFYVNSNMEVEAVYSNTTEKENIIVMSEPVIVSGNKIAFFAERNIVEENSVIEAGILLHTGENVSLDNYTYKSVCKNNANNGQFTVRKANVSSGESWYAAAYVIYTDGENIYTIYSNEVSKTM